MNRKPAVTIVALVVVGVLIAGTVVGQPPQPPMSLYGEATVNGNDGASGYTIVAINESGAQVGSIKVENGSYGGSGAFEEKLDVECACEAGEIIRFRIGDAEANETAPFESGEVKRLDLTFTGVDATTPTATPTETVDTPTPTPTPTPTSTPTATDSPTPIPTPTATPTSTKTAETPSPSPTPTATTTPPPTSTSTPTATATVSPTPTVTSTSTSPTDTPSPTFTSTPTPTTDRATVDGIDGDPDARAERPIEGGVARFEVFTSVRRITFGESVEGSVTIREFADPSGTVIEEITDGILGSSGSEGTVLTVLDISPSGQATDASATIEIEVSREKLEEPGDAAVVHEAAGGWERLETTVAENGSETTVLAANVSSYSLFAVVEVSQSRSPTPGNGSGGLPVPQPLWIALVAGLVVLGAVVLWRRGGP
jgi:hypothetical protein